MTDLQRRILGELNSLRLIDPHTHINALDPASHTLADILGYHYYTELAHSSGLARELIEEPGIGPKEKVGRLVTHFGAIDNTIQYSWFLEIVNEIFGYECDRFDESNWESIYEHAESKMQSEDWAQQVLDISGLDEVFLTNDFDDPLVGFDTSRYIPCLRTDDLVFHLAKQDVRDRLAAATGSDVLGATSLRNAIGKLFDYFVSKNARACAISLPPDFCPTKVSDARAETAIVDIYKNGSDANENNKIAASKFVFWTLAEYCNQTGLPFDLMIGVNRSVYPAGVYQGMDLFDSRVSLIQYRDVFNAFPKVTFPISVLASVTNQELVSYSWIFPNVVTNGHWWYSNTPSIIERDTANRLEAVPRTKQIGYYSDMYKLEFALPKFNMYKRILAKVLSEEFVIQRNWDEVRALELGKQVLRGNVENIFMQNEVTSPALGTVGNVDLDSSIQSTDSFRSQENSSESPSVSSSSSQENENDHVLKINLD